MKLNKILSIALVMLLLIGLVNAKTYPDLNNKLVNDFANLMTQEQEQNLTNMLLAINNNSTVEIAVVTIQTTDGEDRTEFANHIGEQNGVGKKATDNGVVLLWTIENENGGGIATGRGIESVLNSATVSRIGRAARPLFDDKKVYEGFVQMINDINIVVTKSGEYQGIAEQPDINTLAVNSDIPPIIWAIIIIIGIFIILALLSSVTSDDFGGGGGSFRGGGYIGGGFSGGGFSSGGSGGGFSFGGGSFGGGGGHF